MTTITKMIVHKLNLVGEAPIYSNKLIDLDKIENQKKTLEFFINHLETSREQSAVKGCKFNKGPANIVRDAVNKISESIGKNDFNTNFIKKSKQITDHLYASMKNKSPSDGALFIVLYKQEQIDYLGILKMDPNTGITIDDDLNLHVHTDMLPSINEKLHKSGFIYLNKNIGERELDLFVLDKQQGQKDPAKYFMQDFFKAKEAANPENITKHVTESIIQVVCKEIIEPDKKRDFASNVNRHMATTPQFDLDEDLPVLIRNYFEDGYNSDGLNKQIKTGVKSKVADATFNFIPQKDKIKDIQCENPKKTIKLSISASLPKESYVLEKDEDGYIVFKFRKDIWNN